MPEKPDDYRREIVIFEGETKEILQKKVKECHEILKYLEPTMVTSVLCILIESLEDCTGLDFVKSYQVSKSVNKKIFERR